MGDAVDIEIETVPLKDIIAKVDATEIKITKQKEVSNFVGKFMCGAIKFPVIVDTNNIEEILVNKDKLQVLKLFLENNLPIDSNDLGLYFGSGYAEDLPMEIYERLLLTAVTVIYIDKKHFSKEVMDDIARELNFYPYPSCINTIL